MTTDTTFIYALIDPETAEFRYVGKADDPPYRLQAHLAPVHLKKKTHKNHWLKGLLAKGLKPVQVILEEVPKDAWQSAEQRWISWAKDRGYPLTNLTAGGDGLPATDPELVEQLRQMNKARWAAMPPEEKARRMAHLQRPEVQRAAAEKMRGVKKPRQRSMRYDGVSYSNRHGRWLAYLKESNKKREVIGMFTTEEEAGAAVARVRCGAMERVS